LLAATTNSISTDLHYGAGPGGAASSFEAGLLKRAAIVIDALPQVGGSSNGPPRSRFTIFRFPEVPLAEADLVINLMRQIEPFHP
jgi:hypothetical protein